MYEAIADPYRYGSQGEGKAKRAGIALSTIADIVIVYSSIRILLGTSNVCVDGQPREERQIVSDMLLQPWGRWAVILIAAGTICYALFMFALGFIYNAEKG